jgi:Holliday junction resolvase RusA-like endonuclease
MKHIYPIVSFKVLGVPRPQPRPRFAQGRVVAEIDPKVKQWQAAGRHAATMAKEGLNPNVGGLRMDSAVADALGGGKALRVDITFYFGTRHAERWGKPHTHRPDRDNLDKLVLDEMTKVQLIGGDDCRVSAGTIRKRWCDLTGSGALVEVYADDSADTSAKGVNESSGGYEKPSWLEG